MLLFYLSLCAAPPAAMTLEEAVHLSLANNERARIATQGEVAAHARVIQARAAFLPSLSVTGAYTARPDALVRFFGSSGVVVQNKNALDAVATVDLTLLDMSAFPFYSAAKRGAEAATANAEDARLALSQDAAQTFLAALTAMRVESAAASRLDFAKQNQEDAAARLAAGLVGSNDLTRAELERASAETALLVARGARQVTLLELGYVTGAPAPTDLAPPEGLLEAARAPSLGLDELVTTARRDRPDLLALSLEAEAAADLVYESWLHVVPSLGLFALYHVTNDEGVSGREHDAAAGVTLRWNLFDGGAYIGQASERSALAAIADLENAAASRRVVVDVEAALVALSNGRAAEVQATAAHHAAQNNAEETRGLYRQGLASALEVTDANLRAFDAAVNLWREQQALLLAFIGLRASLGRDPLGMEPTP